MSRPARSLEGETHHDPGGRPADGSPGGDRHRRRFHLCPGGGSATSRSFPISLSAAHAAPGKPAGHRPRSCGRGAAGEGRSRSLRRGGNRRSGGFRRAAAAAGPAVRSGLSRDHPYPGTRSPQDPGRQRSGGGAQRAGKAAGHVFSRPDAADPGFRGSGGDPGFSGAIPRHRGQAAVRQRRRRGLSPAARG